MDGTEGARHPVVPAVPPFTHFPRRPPRSPWHSATFCRRTRRRVGWDRGRGGTGDVGGGVYVEDFGKSGLHALGVGSPLCSLFLSSLPGVALPGHQYLTFVVRR